MWYVDVYGDSLRQIPYTLQKDRCVEILIDFCWLVRRIHCFLDSSLLFLYSIYTWQIIIITSQTSLAFIKSLLCLILYFIVASLFVRWVARKYANGKLLADPLRCQSLSLQLYAVCMCMCIQWFRFCAVNRKREQRKAAVKN